MRCVPSILMSAMGAPPNMFCANAAVACAISARNASARPATSSVAFNRSRNSPTPQRHLGEDVLKELNDLQRYEIVPGGKQHQAQYQRKSEAQTPFLGPGTERAAAQRLGAVEEQPAAIEQRYGEEIDQAEIDREEDGEVDGVDDAAAEDVPRHLGDPQHAADLVARPDALDDLA